MAYWIARRYLTFIKKISLKKFIFSNEFFYRVSRHVVFWLVRFCFSATRATAFSLFNANSGFVFSKVIVGSLSFTLYRVTLIEIPFCYFVAYFLLPNFLLSWRYKEFFFYLALAIVLEDLFKLYITKTAGSSILFFLSLNSFFIEGPVAICAVFLGIKMFKNWYKEEEEKKELVKANSEAEIELLKAQIHPHFLFNTLNNIYSFALDQSSVAETMVLSLSDIMKYMVNDCSASLISVTTEIKTILNYIELQKVRYGDFDLQTELDDEYGDKMIAPLLMIPFVENSFKHGIGKMLKNTWMQLSIRADENVLHFILANSKSAGYMKASEKGIGIENVKKRLELLYPKNYLLKIESTENTFTINMQIPMFSTYENI